MVFTSFDKDSGEGDRIAKEKANNTSISRKRILSKPALGAMKRLRVVSDIYRNIGQNLEDDLMLAACGFWNYHLREAQSSK